MANHAKYQTRQGHLLLDYLKSIPGAHVTAADVYRHFREQGAAIGQTTVYRQLERLVGENVLHKYIVDENSPACFAYEGAEARHHEEKYFHCKCEKCGRLIHLCCEELEGIQSHLRAEHHFLLDPMRTVFYGFCDECMEKQRSDIEQQRIDKDQQ